MRIVSSMGIYALEGGPDRKEVPEGAGFRYHSGRCGSSCKACRARLPLEWWWTDNANDVGRAVILAERYKITIEIDDAKLKAHVDAAVALRKAQSSVDVSRTVEMKLRVKLKPGCGDTAKVVAAVVAKTVQRAFTPKLKASLDYEGISILEHRETALPEEWVSIRGLLGADRIPADVAAIFRQAIAKVRKTDSGLAAADGWRALELVCADYIAGPGASADPKGD